MYTWSDTGSDLWRSLTWTPSIINAAMNYGTGGYLRYLSPLGVGGTAARRGLGSNSTAVAIMNAELDRLENGFVDAATRALAFTAVYFNAPEEMFTVIRVVFEFSPTQFMSRTPGVKSYRLMRYSTFADTLADHWPAILLLAALTYVPQGFACMHVARKPHPNGAPATTLWWKYNNWHYLAWDAT